MWNRGLRAKEKDSRVEKFEQNPESQSSNWVEG